MKRLLLLLLVAAVAGCSGVGTAVDLTVDASRLGGALSRVTQLMVRVDADSHFAKAIDVHKVIAGGVVRVRYLPGLKSGTLGFAVDAEAANGSIVASGATGPVTLVAGKTVSATLVLGAGGGDMSIADLAGGSGGGDMTPTNGCTSSSQCNTAGGCVDGYCCDKPCNDACHACNLPGLTGLCSPVPVAKMPAAGHPGCGPDPVASCKRDGTCDGAGSCRIAPGGTVCGPAVCNMTNQMFTAASTCDGNGTCVAGSTISCVPFACQNASACYTSCTGTNSGCSAGNVCNMGSCGLKGDGAGCMKDAECQHGHCVDKVCCNSACTATCYTCNQQSFLGKCHVVPASSDPRGNCPTGSGANATCSPGLCNGAGACNQGGNGVVCQAQFCSGGAQTNQGTCSGATCSIPSAVPCSPYVCGTNACANPCTSSADCITSYTCVNGACVDCRQASAASTAYVDPANGSDDALHGGGTGQCAYRTIGFALTRATSGICAANNGAYGGETYPLTLTGSQALNCDCGNTGTRGVLASGSTPVNLNGPDTSLTNCEVSSVKGQISCVVVPAGVSGGTITIAGNYIHDCLFDIYANDSSTLVITGNTLANGTNLINSLGNANVLNNSFNCGGGGDAINGCAQGDAVNGSGNTCASCTIGCNGCGATPNCFASTFWTTPCP